MLDLISFVGVDEHTNLDKLVKMDLSTMEAFEHMDNPPYVEYGFLYSETRSKTADARYPSLEFIHKSMIFLNSGITSTSFHICGKEAVGRYLKSDPEFMEIGNNSRIQLNFGMDNYNIDELLENILEVSNKHFLPLIVQSNKSKEKFVDKLVKRMKAEYTTLGVMPNIDILYDGSGGFGREIETVNYPYKNIFTGYAGGLKPGNIGKVLDLIDTEIGKHDSDTIPAYYIDMESGVRTDNKFDLNKCQAVIDEVAKYLEFMDTSEDSI